MRAAIEAAREIKYESTSNNLRSIYHLISGELCKFAFCDARGNPYQYSYSTNKNFHSNFSF